MFKHFGSRKAFPDTSKDRRGKPHEAESSIGGSAPCYKRCRQCLSLSYSPYTQNTKISRQRCVIVLNVCHIRYKECDLMLVEFWKWCVSVVVSVRNVNSEGFVVCLVNLAPFVMVMVEKRRRWEWPYWEMEENEGHSLYHYHHL